MKRPSSKLPARKVGTRPARELDDYLRREREAAERQGEALRELVLGYLYPDGEREG